MSKDIEQDKGAVVNAAVTITYLLIEAAPFIGEPNATANLFANGRQACPVVVKLTAVDADNIPVRLPDTAITLIPYIGSNEQWTQSAQSSPFLPFPQGSFLPDAVPTENTVCVGVTNDIQVFNRYIYMPESLAHGQKMQIAVKVTLPGLGTTFTTNNEDVPYGPTGEHGRFKSFFYIQPFAPTQYTKANGMHIETDQFQDRFPIDNRGAGVVHARVTLTNPSTNRVVHAVAPASGLGEVSATHHNKATGIIYPNEDECKHSALNEHYKELMSKDIQKRNAVTLVVGMIAYFTPGRYLPDSRNATYSGWLDAYGNPFNIVVILNSIDPANQNMPWQFTMTIDGN